ncbi:MAG: DUF6512 family protein [Oscillospiraceae bacterium]|jgi:hypothetical protein|nr:DUF6512 family protein [Oscillospiraceae bacterium]
MKRERAVLSGYTGLAVTVILAVIFQNSYYWMGEFHPAGLLFAVNSSVWEQVKCMLLSFYLWSVPALFWGKSNLRRFVTARVGGSLVTAVTAIILFFTVQGVLGFRSGIITGLIVSISLAAGAYCSYRIECYAINAEEAFLPALLAGILLMIAVLCLTALPPHIGLFYDDMGFYGFR